MEVSAARLHEPEKVEIAKRLLIPKQIKSHGLEEKNIAFTDEALQEVIGRYTREAGVRNMEREISLGLPQGRAQGGPGGQGASTRRSRPDNVDELPRHPALPETRPGRGERDRHGHRPGLDRGRRRDPAHRGHADAGQGRADGSPGKLGDVMQESAHAAMSLRALARGKLGIAPGVQPQDRHPHPRAGGRHPQGRAFGRDHHRDRPRLRARRKMPVRRTWP